MHVSLGPNPHRFPGTVMAAVHTWSVPERWSIHVGWNAPPASATIPAVCPRDSMPGFLLVISFTGTLGIHVSPPSSDARSRKFQPLPSAARPRRSY